MPNHAALDAERQAMVESFREQYPSLIAFMIRKLPGLLGRVRAIGHDEADIEQTAWLGVVRAASMYEVEKTNGGSFATYALWHVRGAVTRLADMRVGEPRREELLSLDFQVAPDSKMHDVVAAKVSNEFHDERTVDAFWAAILAKLPRKKHMKYVIDMRYRRGMNLREIGRNLRLNRETVRQIELRALESLASHVNEYA